MSTRLLVCLVTCALIGSLSTPVRAADVDIAVYLQRVTVARDALTQAGSLTGGQRDAAIQRAREALDGIDGVTVDGMHYPAPHGDALAVLRRTPPDTERAVAELTSLYALLADEQAATPDAQARQELDRVLSDRAFHEAAPNVIQKQAIRLQSWIGEQLRRLFQPLQRAQPPKALANTPGAGPLARLLVLLGSPLPLILLALILLALGALVLTRRLRIRAKKAHDEALSSPRTAAEWRAYAESLAARGDHRAAVRALFLGTLMELDERRLVAFDTALTDREYLREAQWQQWLVAEPLRPFVRLIEAIVYANAVCNQVEYERARGYTDDLRRLTDERQVMAA